MDTPKHTALPWKVTRNFVVGPVSQADDQSNGMVIPLADVFGDNREADAAFIVCAVNSHAALLSALKAMVLNDSHTYRDCHKAALAAISQAEGDA